MKKMIRIFGIVVAWIVFAGILLAGCTTSQENDSLSGDTGTRTDEQETVVLTYGYIDAYSFQDMPDSIRERIVAFNRSQNEYFIEIIKYGEDSYTDGLNALNADISAGKGPDILEIANEQLLYQYGRKGIIEDLYSYLDEGEWPGREDFVENILANFEVDGKLYGMVPFFKIMSLIGNPNCIDMERVSFAQLKEMYEENRDNEDIRIYNALTKRYLLYYCILPSIESFVDLEAGTCDFVNADFQELLEFSAQFEDYDVGTCDQMFEDYDKLQEDKMYLYFDGPIGSFKNYTHYRVLMGKSALLVGFPSLAGCGPKINTNSSYLAINSKSKHKDIAWQFICTFLEDQYLSSHDNYTADVGFPVTRSGFESMLQKALEENTELDENGNIVSGEHSISYTSLKGEERKYPIYSPTEEEAAYIREIISNAKPRQNYGQIEEIIGEEIENYWNGTKTVQEVMEVIQNRAQLYLNEL